MDSKLKKEEVTKAIIDGWKEKYEGVFSFTAKDDSGFKAFFCSPDRKQIEAAQAVGNKPLDSNLILAKACFLAGDEEVYKVQKYFIGLSEQLSKIIVKVEGELEVL
jgi:hypothetical protein